MNQNSDNNSQQFLEKTHYQINLMSHEAPQLIDTDGGSIAYYITPKNQHLPVFDVTYNTTTEIMRVASYKKNVRCSFIFPRRFLDLPINNISIYDIIDRTIEFEYEVNDTITILFPEPFDWYFNHYNLYKCQDIINIFSDIRYAALQLQSIKNK